MSDDGAPSAVRVLLTGSGGFVGAHVARALIGAGYRVRAATGPPGCDLPAPVCAEEVLELDVCDEGAVRRAVADRDVIVHLAGPPSVAESFTRATEFARVHVQGTTAVIDAAHRAGVPRFVYVSSAEVYGRPRCDPVAEDHPLEARSPYGACKIAAEQMLGAFAFAYGHDVVVLRPFSLYGPGAPASSLISRILQLATRGEPLILQDLRPVRDYCFITDFANAVVRACELPAAAGVRAFNVGTGRGTSVAHVAEIVLCALGMDGPVSAGGDGRPGASDILRLVADTSRATTELRWTPIVPLEQGLHLLLTGAR